MEAKFFRGPDGRLMFAMSREQDHTALKWEWEGDADANHIKHYPELYKAFLATESVASANVEAAESVNLVEKIEAVEE